jgi:hypothetical protein
MALSIADKIFLVAGLFDLGGLIICLGVVFHMAYTKMDLMLGHLKNCSVVSTHAPLKEGGPWGRLLLIGWIAGIVTFPGYYLKNGGVSTEDLMNFPAHLKRRLVVTKWVAIVLLVAMILLFVLRKSGVLK